MDIVNMSKQPRPKPPRGYHHGDLRRELVTAAMNLLDEQGIDAVTVRAVAREADVAHSAPANHFKDRTALLTQLAVETFQALIQDVDAASARSGSAKREQIEAFADVVLRFAFKHPHRYRLLWRADSIDQSQAEFQASGGAVYERLRQIMANGKATHALSPDTHVVAAWALVHGYISLRLDGTLIAGKDEQTGAPRERAIITALLDGIGSE
jgi:AcrR family transcriptional regulator